MRTWKVWRNLFLVVSLCLCLPFDATPAPQERLRVNDDPGSGHLTIAYNNRPILVYAYSAKQHKPYIKELFDLSGYNVVTDTPPDHLHHHGVMYGVIVNGVDYWHEDQGTGTERSIQIVDKRSGVTASGHPYARFVDVVHWLDPAGLSGRSDKRTVLVELRSITLIIDEATKEVAVQWSSDFTVSERDTGVVLTGTPYNGLGIRLTKDFDARVVHFTSEQPLNRLQGDPLIVKARWTAASIDGTNHGSTVALFGDPSNRSGESVFFLMYEPFAYVSSTQALNTHALDYPSGARFRLNHLLVVYPAARSFDFIRKRGEQWEQAGYQAIRD